jgi:hypothetical protein
LMKITMPHTEIAYVDIAENLKVNKKNTPKGALWIEKPLFNITYIITPLFKFFKDVSW